MICPCILYHHQEELRKHRDAIEAKGKAAEEEEEEEEDEEDIELVKQQKMVDGMTALHVAAAEGDLLTVISLLRSFESGSVSGSSNYDMLHARDANDWQAIHEAASAGHLEVLKYLIDKGSDISAMTKEGGTVLWWAKKMLDKSDPVIAYLEEIGAPDKETPMYP
jgi:Ankyrin repeats (3 copies)